MHRNRYGKRSMGPWGNLHTAVWLIGIGILIWSGKWWPGILLLVGLSMIIEGLAARSAPQALEQTEWPASPQPAPGMAPAPVIVTPATPSEPPRRLELLPTTCPSCGGPIRGHEVRWTGAQSADCPYCGTNLPMKNRPA